MTPRQSSTVEFSDVAKDFGRQRVLHGFNRTVGPGEFVSLLGPSGCGKTTALRVLAGLEDATSGAVLLNGVDVTRQPTNKRDIGMVFQSYSLFPHLSAARNVMFGLEMRRMRPREAESRARDMLELVGLGAYAERYPHQLSGGQQQRVALARALVTEPRVLVLDEPLSALDAKVREQLREEIRRIQLRLGITTVFVTHDQEEALAVSDRVAVMNAGGIEQIGSPEQLYTRPATPFVARFVGQSNRVQGMASGAMVELYGHPVPLLERAPGDGPVEVLVRPEDIQLSSTGIPAVVLASSFLGSIRRTSVQLGDGTVLVVQHSVHQNPQPGESLGIVWGGQAVARSSTTAAAYIQQ